MMMRCILSARNGFSIASNFTILRGRYLVEAKPKKSVSAFLLFSNEFRQKQGSLLKSTEVLRKAGATWKTMSEQQKKPYEIKAEEEKEKYQKVREAYHASFEEPFRLSSAYNLFTEEYYSKEGGALKKIDFKERAKVVSDAFKRLSEINRREYEKKADLIKAIKEKKIEQYEIPQFKYANFLAFKRSHPNLSQQEYLALFKQEKEKYSAHLKQWLSSKNLTEEEFIKLVQKTKRSEKSLLKKDLNPNDDKSKQQIQEKINQSLITKSLNKFLPESSKNKNAFFIKKAIRAKMMKKKVESKTAKKTEKTSKAEGTKAVEGTKKAPKTKKITKTAVKSQQKAVKKTKLESTANK